MNLMLAFMFVCVALGLLARQVGRREQLAIAMLATAMTGLYLFTNRFM